MRIGRDVQPDDPKYGTYLYGPNHWPDLPEGDFRKPIMEYREHMLQLAKTIMCILAEGLSFGAEVFDEFMEDPVASVKLLHYPPQSDVGEQLGGTLIFHLCNPHNVSITDNQIAGAHTDFGAITLLLQHPGQEGLEVLHPATNSWLSVPTIEDTYVVNIGDVLCTWTQGQYRSATHRVINRHCVDRYSIPFFYDGTMTTRMIPLDGSVVEGGCKTIGDHFQERFREASVKK